MDSTPRIEAVEIKAPFTVRVRWRGERKPEEANLSGWIKTGGDILLPLIDPAVFRTAKVASYGSAIEWNDDEDLAIDAVHLKKLAEEQKPFSNAQLRDWQVFVSLSNAECADLVGVSMSTWALYRKSAQIPRSVAITCRASLRDPLVIQAHLRPRTSGRPRKEAE